MFHHAHSKFERLSTWRSFRQNFEGSVQDIVDEFSKIKVENRYIDYYTPEHWPTVFEIVQEGMFCQSGMTLVMAATLDYCGLINSQKIHLPVISNYISGNEGLVLVHEDMCYNFLPGKIVERNFMKENSNLYDTHVIAIDKLYH